MKKKRKQETKNSKQDWQDKPTDLNSTHPQSMPVHPSKTPTQSHRQVQTNTNSWRQQ